jgi:hypothetical protein
MTGMPGMHTFPITQIGGPGATGGGVTIGVGTEVDAIVIVTQALASASGLWGKQRPKTDAA